MDAKQNDTDFIEERLRQIREGLQEGARREVERLESLGLPLCTEDSLDDFETKAKLAQQSLKRERS